MRRASLVRAAVVGLLAAGSAGALIQQAVGSTGAVIEQKGNLRVKVTGSMTPQKLPREGAAPIAVSVGGEVSTTDGTLPPLLKRMQIEINEHGHLDPLGLPVCSYDQIQPATDERALANCGRALVGQGTFDAYILLDGQEPYPTTGRLLLFNGRLHGTPTLFGHIFISQPFATSFVIPFEITKSVHGRFGLVMTANLTKALGDRRVLTGIEMKLERRFHYEGERRSYLSAGCPAPKGLNLAIFPLMRTTFTFVDGKKLTSTLTGTCKTR